MVRKLRGSFLDKAKQTKLNEFKLEVRTTNPFQTLTTLNKNRTKPKQDSKY